MQSGSRVTRVKIPKKPPGVERSSGNVFADLGLPDSGELLAKAKLVSRICEVIEKKKLTQVKAAKLLGIDQPKVSSLLRGRFEGYSSDRLFRFLNALGQEVEIMVKSTRRQNGPGVTRVVAS